MEEFIDFKHVQKVVKLPVSHIYSRLRSKQFPLPVKDKNGYIVWVKSEVLGFSKQNGHLKTFNKRANGRVH
jgi:predicted DNA-binding transcriptional regulator AlpA